VFIYEGMTYGLIPDHPKTSWESHVFSAAIGTALAFYLRDFKAYRLTLEYFRFQLSNFQQGIE